VTVGSRFGAVAWKAWACFRRDLLTDFSYRVTFAIDLVDALLVVVSYAFLARVFGGTQPDGYRALDFLVVGVAASGGFTTALQCFKQGIRGTQSTGTIKAVMSTPTSPTAFLVLSAIYPMLRAGADTLVFLAGGAWIGLSVRHVNAGGAVLAFVLGLLGVAVFGILSAASAIVLKRGDPVIWTIGTLMWLLSGVLYPTSVLPPWLERVAWCLPTTHALTALRALLLDGVALAAVWPHLVFLAAFAAIGVPASLWAFERAVRFAKHSGTLGHV
jgi:ABC-2 type transport system permease protein